MAWVDKKGRTIGHGDWPPGTEKWADFGTGSHASMQHPTQHNLSPVEGDHTQAHRNYSADKSAKADWHYERWGNPKQPQATLAKAGLNDFKSRVARNWPGDK